MAPGRSGEVPLAEGFGRTGGSGRWWLPALGLVVIIGGLAALSVNGRPTADVAPGPTATPSATVAPTPTPVATPAPVGRLEGRYLDGIPTAVGGQQVYRLTDLGSERGPRSASVVIGGWFRVADCAMFYRTRCGNDTLADNPASLVFPTVNSVALVAPGRRLSGSGPIVVRGSFTFKECVRPASSAAQACPTSLTVTDVLWSGDVLTDAGPLAVVPVMADLAAAFPDFAPRAALNLADCSAPFPPQTYVSTGSPVRLVAIFPTRSDAAIEGGVLETTRWPDCAGVAKPALASWVVRDNALVLIDSGAAQVVGKAQAALAGVARSSTSALPDPTPFSPWLALRALGDVRGSIAGLLLNEPTCGLPTRAWSLDMPLNRSRPADGGVLLLAVFDSIQERAAFEAAVSPMKVGAEACGHAPIAALVDGRRWLSYRNLLLLLTGPSSLDLEIYLALAGAERGYSTPSADGIPAQIGGEPVYRVPDALVVPVGQTILVGGWYHAPTCQARPRLVVVCSGPTLADSATGPGGSRIALDVDLGPWGAARVVRAVVEADPSCPPGAIVEGCVPSLHVLAPVWSSNPPDSQPLMRGSLSPTRLR